MAEPTKPVDIQPSPATAPTERARTGGPTPPSRRGKGVLARLKPSFQAVPPRVEEIIKTVRAHHVKADGRQIAAAYATAEEVHQGQFRKSGEPFINHPIAVAKIIADLEMDPTTVIAGFLHDSVEDTELSIESLRGSFGDEVAEIIDGLTKIEKIPFRSQEQERARNLRKMILAMARDPRVIVVKLADRLHNMRTLEALEPARRELIATDTLEIYAPLAHRLGMQQIKVELEDLAFKTLYPKRYDEIEQMVALRLEEREKYLSAVISAVSSRLRDVKVKAEVNGRQKHLYSIYEKMIGRGREFDEIFDLVGVRIIVDSEKDCYAALGAIHSLWTPLPDRFKDYIATPKFNIYQSLHTTVIGPEGKPLEVQIRTKEMHLTAELGIAAHWSYKEDPRGRAWMRRMVDLQQTEDDSEFLAGLRMDLYSDEVFVFTPQGDIVELPQDSTPIDFAYSIHTEVGHACIGARVDGRLVPLARQLASGETVEVLTSNTPAGPSRDWLDVVVTPRAKSKIKQWFTKERKEEALAEGRDALAKACRKVGIPLLNESTMNSVAEELHLSGKEGLLLAIGEGRVAAQTVVQRLLREESGEEEAELAAPRVRTKPATVQGVVVEGVDDVWVKLARCCMPVPGDRIVGFVTRGRGVSVHLDDCPNIAAIGEEDERRLLPVKWDALTAGSFPVQIQIEALDRPKLLRDVTTVVSDLGVNISSASSQVGRGIAALQFTFEISNPSQLQSILKAVRRVDSVYDAYRITPRPR